MIPKRSVWADIEPNGISGDPGLPESDQCGSLACSPSNEFESLCEACGFVMGYGCRLGNRNTQDRSRFHSHTFTMEQTLASRLDCGVSQTRARRRVRWISPH